MKFKMTKRKKSALTAVLFTVMLILVSIENTAEDTYIIAYRNVDVRNQSYNGSEVVYSINNGDLVHIIGVYDDWYKIVYNGEIGYVHESELLTDENGNYIYVASKNKVVDNIDNSSNIKTKSATDESSEPSNGSGTDESKTPDEDNMHTWVVDASKMSIEDLNRISGATDTYDIEENEKTDEEAGIEGIWIE